MANDIDKVPSYFVNRCHVFKVRPPSKDEERQVLESVYTSVLEENDLTEHFSASLDELCIHSLAGKRPRDMHKAINAAIAKLLDGYTSLPGEMFTLRKKDFEEKKKNRSWI